MEVIGDESDRETELVVLLVGITDCFESIGIMPNRTESVLSDLLAFMQMLFELKLRCFGGSA